MVNQQNQNTLPRGWHSRCYLPHFDGGEVAQMLTCRLADSVPVSTIETWQETLGILASAEGERKYRQLLETYLDRGIGACWLKDPSVARGGTLLL